MKKEGTPQDVVDDTIELADRLGANRILFLGDYDMMHLLVEGRNCVPEDWEIGLICDAPQGKPRGFLKLVLQFFFLLQ